LNDDAYQTKHVHFPLLLHAVLTVIISGMIAMYSCYYIFETSNANSSERGGRKRNGENLNAMEIRGETKERHKVFDSRVKIQESKGDYNLQVDFSLENRIYVGF
jgi:hypothetical protein